MRPSPGTREFDPPGRITLHVLFEPHVAPKAFEGHPERHGCGTQGARQTRQYDYDDVDDDDGNDDGGDDATTR